MINADDLIDWRAAGNWRGISLKEVVDMRRQERADLIEDFWNLDDAAVRVEEAFEDLVKKRVDMMRELASSSKKELTKALMYLLDFEEPGSEKVVLSEDERKELIRIGQMTEKNHMGEVEKKVEEDQVIKEQVIEVKTMVYGVEEKQEHRQKTEENEQTSLDLGMLLHDERGLMTPGAAVMLPEGGEEQEEQKRG